jgi:crossover junction endodeoxyribonuclease RuvC
VKPVQETLASFAESWGLSAVELAAFVTLRASEITTLHPDTLRRKYPDKVVQLSERRQGMRLGHVLEISQAKKAPAQVSAKTVEFPLIEPRLALPPPAPGQVLSIDPGLLNGVAVLDPRADLLFATEIAPIGEGARKRLPLAQLVDLIEQYAVTHAVVEDVSAMPQQGVTSSFRFGRATGSFEGVLSAFRIPTAFIRAAVWKKSLGVSATKEGARCLALQRWPTAAHFFSRKRDHNRAEAALLGAYYVERQSRVAA